MNPLLPRLVDAQNALNAVTTAVLLVEKQEIIFANRAARTLLRDPENCLVGQPFPSLFTNESEQREMQVRCCDGALLWVEMTCAPVDEADDDLLAVTIIDISERKRQSESYHAQEQLLQAIVQNIPANVWAIDKQGVYTFMGGLRHEDSAELIGKSIHQLYAQVPGFIEDMYRVLAGEIVNRERELSGAIYDTHYAPLRAPDGQITGAVGVGFDITVLKMALEALRQSEQQYRHLIEQAFEGIIVLTDGRPSLINDSACDLLGFTREELQRHRLSELIHPDDMLRILKARDELMTGNRGLAEFRIRHKEGHWISVEGSAVQLDDGQLQIALRDVTDRTQAAQAALEQQRLRAELEKEQAINKLKTQLMRRIAHEFRTPLATMRSASDMLTDYAAQLTVEQQHERLRVIQSEITRLTVMLDDIAEAVRTSFTALAFQPQPVNLNHLCQRLIDDLRATRAANHQLIYTVESADHVAEGDEKILETVIGNLLSNAIKYSPPQSQVELRLSSTDDQVVVQVKDEGIGIPPEDLEFIFEPFYRGGNFGQISGIGLGLTIVRDGVEAHSGRIEVSSAPGQGTSFTLRLPRLYKL
jgi:PAS domain S-box-containing protein